MRVLLPSTITQILVVLLLFILFFTDFDWQWVTLLGGILFVSVLSERFLEEQLARRAQSLTFRFALDCRHANARLAAFVPAVHRGA
ncbi:MAG: hypothetical protein ABIH03_16260 [Pseudomonadota bacterium]